jgi:hypothetical protein
MCKQVAITGKVNELLEAAMKNLGLPKEALVHAILVRALTDPEFMAGAKELCRYLDEKGSEALDKMGL